MPRREPEFVVVGRRTGIMLRIDGTRHMIARLPTSYAAHHLASLLNAELEARVSTTGDAPSSRLDYATHIEGDRMAILGSLEGRCWRDVTVWQSPQHAARDAIEFGRRKIDEELDDIRSRTCHWDYDWIEKVSGIVLDTADSLVRAEVELPELRVEARVDDATSVTVSYTRPGEATRTESNDLSALLETYAEVFNRLSWLLKPRARDAN